MRAVSEHPDQEEHRAAEVPAGTYTLDVNAAGTNNTVLMVPDASLASGGVYTAFAIGTVYVDSLNVLVQDNASGAPPRAHRPARLRTARRPRALRPALPRRRARCRTPEVARGSP